MYIYKYRNATVGKVAHELGDDVVQNFLGNNQLFLFDAHNYMHLTTAVDCPAPSGKTT